MAKPKKKGDLDIPTHIMADLCSRFVINSEKKWDQIQVFDVLENAHWHYLDFYCLQMKPPPPKCNHKVFSKHMLAYLTELSYPLDNFESLYQTWQEKKRLTPCFGGIILTPNYTHVLMVQGFGSKTSWGFPKGKKENLESGINCAVREIEEETGLNVSDKIREDRGIVQWIQDRFHKLYIIPDVPFDALIQAKLRREIKAHKWIPVYSLPVHKNDTAPQQADLDAANFFNVSPFVRPLRKWIEEQGRKQEQQAMPASQFTAKGRRRGKGKDVQRRQGAPGPDGDASTCREGQGRSSRQSQVAKNLGEQFSDMPAASQGGHTEKPVKILSKEESSGKSGGGRQDSEDASADKGGSSSANQIRAGPYILRLDEFHSKAMLNFQFDKQSILDIYQW
ncbi:m7GpppN-mRNA hydrolase-like [Babylonia areolata]|uniref:m7GpppN-mRNA hydrolase-like n=1 Tax=Babylonia areolata TaxID=304850 RepID=UPI003FD304E2